ncbi:MAG: cadherin-like beta sandwich domain-containing protein [Gammaproteobacteria bacterium]|nr:cadherin-like beta sandwich domain-containing protein [Gammaproteobacteria bacterium]MDH3767641.1 cadherin-like beta sandwich domain-containing protein [Gammaproteobacteria bacterium]
MNVPTTTQTTAIATLLACMGLFGCDNDNHNRVVVTPLPPVASAIATLSALSASDATLSPEFNPATTSYTATVPNSTSSVDVVAVTTDSNAGFTINGGSNATVALAEGANTITILVTAENGTSTQSYTMGITRQSSSSNNANLSNLSLTGVTLNPAFDPVVFSYTSMVIFAVSSTAVTPTAEDPNATITVNGTAVDSGTASDPITLNVGSNTITVLMTAEDGTTNRTYTIEVTRQAAAAIAQEAYIKASNTDPTDIFGGSAIAFSDDGSTMAVGALNEQSAATGVNGDETDNSASRAGAVYVFTRDGGGVWTQQAYVKASNSDATDNFGISVALSSDGSTLAVGALSEDSAATGVNGDDTDNSADRAGAVYVYTRDGVGTWTQQAYVKASNTDTRDQFGFSVSLAGDGSTLAVGANTEASSATGVNGDGADNSAFGAGAVYVFTRDGGGVWTQQAYVKASNTDFNDRFGGSVALAGDGLTLAVGAESEDSNAIGVNGDESDNSATSAGAAYVFTRDGGGVWTQQAYVKPSNTDGSDFFAAIGLALSGDGSTLAVGAQGEASNAIGVNGNEVDNTLEDAGATYVFTRDTGGVWTQQAYIKASNTDSGDSFGIPLALARDGSTLAVGAVSEDSAATGVNGDEADNTLQNAGATYLFTRNGGGVWTQQAYVKASNPDSGDFFGFGVALSGDASTLAAGAGGENSAATGVNGDESDNNATSSGAVYVFR